MNFRHGIAFLINNQTTYMSSYYSTLPVWVCIFWPDPSEMDPKFCHCWSSFAQSPRAETSCMSMTDNPNPPFLLFSYINVYVAFKYPSSTVYTAQETWQLNYSWPGALKNQPVLPYWNRLCPQVCHVRVSLCLLDLTQPYLLSMQERYQLQKWIVCKPDVDVTSQFVFDALMERYFVFTLCNITTCSAQ